MADTTRKNYYLRQEDIDKVKRVAKAKGFVRPGGKVNESQALRYIIQEHEEGEE